MPDLCEDILLVLHMFHLLQPDDIRHGEDLHGQITVGCFVPAETHSTESTGTCQRTNLLMIGIQNVVLL